jgi:gamma-glutamylcysteine synthetase
LICVNIDLQPDAALTATIRALAERFTAGFPETLAGPRTVGREAEYPIVDENGAAIDARRLWDGLLKGGGLEAEYGAGRSGQRDFIVGLKGADYSYALEVGLGTVEINTRPCQHLHEVRILTEEAVVRLARQAARFGWRVLGYGVQPLTPPSLRIMAPKQRYQSLYRAMGETWLWYTVTASDQLQVAIRRAEMVDMLNYGNLITPVIIALCANSPVYAGQLSPYCSAREGVMAAIRAEEHRHGMWARPVADMEDFVATLAQSTYLITKAGGEIVPSSVPFSTYLQEHGPDYPAFLFHEHYIWNSARLRSTYGTLEVRPACQQPWRSHMAAGALTLGLLEAMPVAYPWLQEELGAGWWDKMRIYHQQVIRFGLKAPQPAPDLLRQLVALADAALAARGFGEETLLAPIWRRLELGVNPAQRVRAIFNVDGLRGLLNHVTVRPQIR